MDDFYLSYLMGAKNINDNDLLNIGIYIEGKYKDRDFSLKIPKDRLEQYINLVKDRLGLGFWNDIIGRDNIIFIFKFKDGHIKEYTLSLDNELEIAKLCSDFSNTSLDKVSNLYKYLSDNSFYHDFVLDNYKNEIWRTPS